MSNMNALYCFSGERRINFEEFIPIFHTYQAKKPAGNYESFVEAFRVFDRDGNGLISSAEIRHMLTSLG